MNWEFILVLLFGPAFWLYAEVTGPKLFRVVAGLIAFVWVGYWAISITEKYMDTEIKILSRALNNVTSSQQDNATLTGAVNIYREEKKKNDSELKAAMKLNEHYKSISKE